MAKKASVKLYKLIKSLSASEKRNFKSYIKHWSDKDSKYLKLFVAIDKQQSFDDEFLKQVIYGEAKSESRRFSELKSYLYNQILNSLHNYDVRNALSLQLDNFLLNISVLYRRSLFDLIPEQVKKAKKIALDHELFGVLIQLVRWHRKTLHAALTPDLFKQEQLLLNEEEQGYLAKLENITAYRNIFFKMYVIVKRDALIRTEMMKQQMDELLQDPLMQSLGQTKSKTAEILFYRINSFHYYSIGAFEKNYEFNKKIIELMSSSFLITDNSEYISILSNFTFVCIILKKFDEGLETLKILQGLKTATQDDLWKQHRQYFLNYFTICLAKADFEKGLKVIEEHQIAKQNFSDSNFQVDVFYYNYFYIYFGAEQLNNALDILNDWILVPKEIARPDLQSLARVLLLIVHVDMGEHMYFENITRNANRFLKNKDLYFEFEQTMFNALRKVYKAVDKHARKDIYLELEKSLHAIKDEESSKNMFMIFDFISWVESKIQKRSFAEILRDKMNGKERLSA